MPGVDGPVWRRTYLYGVGWQDVHRASVSDHGLETADSTIVYVPVDVSTEPIGAEYLRPIEWRQRTDLPSAYTFKEGDIIVRGIIAVPPEPFYTLDQLRKDYDDVYEIVGVVTCSRGSRATRHFELEVI
jgi:hypothetical protein